jgi:hypothetical protein
MVRSFGILAVAGMTLGLAAGLTGCGSNKEGPADPEQEMKFREKARGLVPGKAQEKSKSSEPDAKQKATDPPGVTPQDKKKE